MRAAGAAVAAVAALGALAFGSTAAAKTYTVTKRTDPAPNGCHPHDCSLREAVIAANGHSGADRVVLTSSKTYELSIENTGVTDGIQGDVDIVNDPLTIEHPGKGRAIIDANQVDRVFEVYAGAPTTLRKLKVTGGANGSGTYHDGGGIRADAALRLVKAAVVGNDGEDGDGGGINATGNVTLGRSTIAHNKADEAAGAEIGGRTVIRRSRILDNEALNAEGGMYLYPSPGVDGTIDRTTITGNRAGGTFGNAGAMDYAGSDTTLRITRSTISGNRATYDGGGIRHIFGNIQITNSTIAGNHADRNGGGIVGYGQGTGDGVVSLNAVTVARNTAGTGGGLYNGDGPDGFTVQNSLIVLNSATVGGDDCVADGAGSFGSLGHNLLSTLTDCSGFDRPSDIVRANPKIGTLGHHGGPTKTIPLRKHSAAIGHAKRSTAPKRDQRGHKRDRHPDSGGFER